MKRRTILAALAGAMAVTLGLATEPAAQAAGTFPDKPITFVVPFAPGGISDVMARAISAAMAPELGQPVVVLNKPSPGMVLGLSEIANAKPDGYTIGIWANSAYTFPIGMKTTVPYDGIDGFTFLRSYSEFVLGVVVRADAPWKTFQELVEEGKKSPGKLKFGSVGINSIQHLIMEQVMKDTGAKFVHVPQAGTAAGIANVLGGHLDFLSDASSWAPNVRQGQLRLLAYTGDQRSKFFPDAPTYKELGFDVVRSRGAIVAPARLPEPIRAKLEAAIDKALKDPKVVEAFAGIATEIGSMPGEEMRTFSIADRKQWEAMLGAAPKN
ncbi:Bug family tripartite tricarboxylate transporter substrate binding protein [Chelatococcus reniformis]|uniref:Tripartite tricarboxylate transporter substrate binding protein n=1 Tax=Chelatococcus reniformis TaxID=1494448 RepID=A0A916UTC2_9HYPH|nr:tripartite tricarboxylate transporter substrate binding protein [Chelatococcus reniformis]GGC86864.1 hypothetical protein GCM10010994_50980 [Chelatococcus reniformis]